MHKAWPRYLTLLLWPLLALAAFAAESDSTPTVRDVVEKESTTEPGSADIEGPVDKFRRGTARSARRQRFVTGPLRFLIAVLLARASFDSLDPTLEARALFEAQTLLILALAWTLLGAVELLFGRPGDRMRRSGQEQATLLLRPTLRGVKVIVLLLAVFVWLDNPGFKITTLLAGLGVTSIAVALAAQKPLENLLGAITLYASQPVRVGEFCRFGDKLGTVEEIGLRSTLLRTPERTLLNIPNASFANVEVENFTQRDKVLYRSTLRLRIETTPDQIRFILV
jgi:MscS family membrane protein